MTRVRKPKPPTLLEETRAFHAELNNALDTEGGAGNDGLLRRARDLISRLMARGIRADGLIDGYSLNLSNGSRLKLATHALIEDSAARIPPLRRRRTRS
jgi:hypothetical protein